MPPTVRRATADDAALIVDYNLRLALESEDKVLDPAVLAPGVARVLADPTRGRYFVAEIDGRVVGQLMITTEWSDWRNGWIWWIQSVYTDTPARRQGVFRALYEHVVRTARNEGDVVGLRLYVENDNHAAQATYLRMGMTSAGYLVLEQSPL
jgi:GNAT superfamily N-acetyltransferase